MHEWALAEAVVSAVSQIAEREGLKSVTEVRVAIGELQQVELDIFRFALSQLKTGVLEKAKFILKVVQARLRCRACGSEWSFSGSMLTGDCSEAVHFVPETLHAYARCPKCGSPDFEVLQGRGIWIESVKGVKPQ